MNDIQKNCWIKETKYKIFNKTLFSKVEICDTSEFQKSEQDSMYVVPKCFNSQNNMNKD